MHLEERLAGFLQSNRVQLAYGGARFTLVEITAIVLRGCSPRQGSECFRLLGESWLPRELGDDRFAPAEARVFFESCLVDRCSRLQGGRQHSAVPRAFRG